MKSLNNKYKIFITLFFILQLNACGGGSDGDTSESRFSISANEINIGIPSNYGQAPDQTISGTVSNYSGPLYLIITHTTNGIGSIYPPTISGNTGTATISMQAKSQGVYFDTITIQACPDSACANELLGSPQVIDLTYSVGVAVDPPSLNFTAAAGDTPPPQTVTVYYNSGNPTTSSWASSYLYLDGSGWMTYTPPNGQNAREVEVSINPYPAGTSPGVFNAEIRFGANQGGTLVTLPIQYTIK